MQHVFPIPLGDLPFLGYSGACRRQTGRDHPRFWMRPPRRHLSSFYAPARYFTQKASSGTALRTNCLPEARERKERTPKKERKKLKPRPPPGGKPANRKTLPVPEKIRPPRKSDPAGYLGREKITPGPPLEEDPTPCGRQASLRGGK